MIGNERVFKLNDDLKLSDASVAVNFTCWNITSSDLAERREEREGEFEKWSFEDYI